MVHRRRKLVVFLLLILAGASSSLPAESRPPSSPKFTILLSNDDGYNAPGLQALIHALQPVGELFVAAPAANESSKAHSLSVGMPIYAKLERQTRGDAFYAIEATPATCVRLALNALMTRQPDVVVTGINRGDNLGLQVYTSGTVGAAREAAFSGLPAIAVSMQGDDPKDYAAAAAYVRTLLGQLRARGLLKPGLFLNVNIPAGKPRGVRVTRLSLRYGREVYERRTDDGGRLSFRQTWHPTRKDDVGTDVEAFERGYITLTPLSLDTTAAKSLRDLSALETREPVAAPAPER